MHLDGASEHEYETVDVLSTHLKCEGKWNVISTKSGSRRYPHAGKAQSLRTVGPPTPHMTWTFAILLCTRAAKVRLQSMHVQGSSQQPSP